MINKVFNIKTYDFVNNPINPNNGRGLAICCGTGHGEGYSGGNAYGDNRYGFGKSTWGLYNKKCVLIINFHYSGGEYHSDGGP